MANYDRYFMFSREQLRIKKELESKIGRTFTPGTVIVKGNRKQYTEMCIIPNNARFPDSRVVIVGDMRTIAYTEPKAE